MAAAADAPFQLPFPAANVTYSPAAFGQAEWVEWDTLIVTLGANAVVLVSCLLYFGFLRAGDPGYFSSKRRKLPEKTPPDLPSGFFSWIPALILINDDDVLKFGGFDATVLLRFYRMALKICLIFSIYGLAVIIPANVRGGLAFTQNSKTSINTFNELSMSNIQHYDSKMWLHAAGLYLLTFTTLYYLVIEFRYYKTLRHEYLRRRHTHHRTIVVEGVPRHMRVSRKLFEYFNILYDGTVSSVRVPQDLTYLSRLLEVRQHVLANLERCLIAERMTGKTPWKRSGFCGCGPKVAAISMYTSQLRRINSAVEREQARRLAPVKNSNALDARDMGSSVQNYDLAAEIRALGLQIDASGAGPIERSVLCRWEVSKALPRGKSRIPTGKPRSGSECNRTEVTESVRAKHRSMSFDLKETAPLMEAWNFLVNDESDEWDAGRQYLLQKYGSNSNEDGKNDDVDQESKYGGNDEEIEALVAATGDTQAILPEQIPVKEQMRATRAFVTFTSYTAATTAQQVLHCAKPGRMAVVPAPEPRDVYWPNIIVSRRVHTSRWLLVEVVLISATVFYPVMVTLLSYMLSPDQLTLHYEVINEICDRSKLFRSAVELIQPLLLLSLMAILPALLYWVGCLEGLIAYSHNQMVVLSRFFTFQVINVFLVTAIAGSMFDVVSKIANHPSDTFTLLGETLPKMAGFFCNYVMIRSMSGLSLELIRAFSFVPAFIRFLTSRDQTPRDRRRIMCGMRAYHDPGPFNYGKVFAQDLLVLTLCMTYACIAPVILVAGVVFFGLAHLVYKHQLLFAYEPQFESGGSFFPKVFRRIIFALFTAQATMVGMFLLKRGMSQVYAISFLMVVTFVCKLKMREMYEPVAASLPIEIAKALDVMTASKYNSGELDVDEYLQPELKAPPDASPVLDEDEVDDLEESLLV